MKLKGVEEDSECELKFRIGETENCDRNWLLVLVVMIVVVEGVVVTESEIAD